MIVSQRLAGKRSAGIGGESKRIEVLPQIAVPSVGRVEEKRNKRHNDGRGVKGRVQAEMQMQLQIGCSFSLALISGPFRVRIRPVCRVAGTGVCGVVRRCGS